MSSGVWVKERLVRNWEHSEAISVGVKPAPSRRSKPCGAAAVAALSRLAAAAAAAAAGGALGGFCGGLAGEGGFGG